VSHDLGKKRRGKKKRKSNRWGAPGKSIVIRKIWWMGRKDSWRTGWGFKRWGRRIVGTYKGKKGLRRERQGGSRHYCKGKVGDR